MPRFNKSDVGKRVQYNVYPTIPAYSKYIGTHMYKFARKYLGKSKLLALELADLPASAMLGGLCGLITQDVRSGVIFALGHQTFTPIAVYMRHRKNVKERQENRVTLDDCVGVDAVKEQIGE